MICNFDHNPKISDYMLELENGVWMKPGAPTVNIGGYFHEWLIGLTCIKSDTDILI